MALNDRDVQFFRPLWRRVAVTAVLGVWCGLEVILSHDQFWIGITGFGVLYCLYTYFWKWPKDVPAVATTAAPATDTVAPPAETNPPKQP